MRMRVVWFMMVLKLWLKEQDCQTFKETEAFPIQKYHICNARPAYITLHSCRVTWISVVWDLIWKVAPVAGGGECRKWFWGAMVSSVYRSCSFCRYYCSWSNWTVHCRICLFFRWEIVCTEVALRGTQRTDLRCNERKSATRCNQISVEPSVTSGNVPRALCSPQLSHWNNSATTVHLFVVNSSRSTQ